MTKDLYLQFCTYNRNMNQKIFRVSSELDFAQLSKNMGAFFKSIQGTLQHIMVADLIWLGRFKTIGGKETLLRELDQYPNIERLDQEIFSEFSQLSDYRKKLDQLLFQFIESLTPEEIQSVFRFKNMAGNEYSNFLWVYLSHLFNHQTHHRGQATTLLTQLGLDIGVTDFPYVIKENL